MNRRCLRRVILHFGLAFPRRCRALEECSPIQCESAACLPFLTPVAPSHSPHRQAQRATIVLVFAFSWRQPAAPQKTPLSHLSDGVFIKHGDIKEIFNASYLTKSLLFTLLLKKQKKQFNVPKQDSFVLNYCVNFAVVSSILIFWEFQEIDFCKVIFSVSFDFDPRFSDKHFPSQLGDGFMLYVFFWQGQQSSINKIRLISRRSRVLDLLHPYRHCVWRWKVFVWSPDSTVNWHMVFQAFKDW